CTLPRSNYLTWFAYW
nr:immunoglobulin heavy chain junction region [Mus musculus]